MTASSCQGGGTRRESEMLIPYRAIPLQVSQTSVEAPGCPIGSLLLLTQSLGPETNEGTTRNGAVSQFIVCSTAGFVY